MVKGLILYSYLCFNSLDATEFYKAGYLLHSQKLDKGKGF